MKQHFCQSCGMPLTEEKRGSNADGSLNEDYCAYCYNNGKFTQDFTMSQMIEFLSAILRPDECSDRYELDTRTG